MRADSLVDATALCHCDAVSDVSDAPAVADVPRCPRCDDPVSKGQRFCGSCGLALHTACRVCGADVAARQRFCADCGTPVADVDAAGDAKPAPTAPPGPVAERRLCSILFVDLVGFTPLSEARDPEAVRELLSQYFETSRSVIERYGGVVEKFIGDAVMAVWGAPVADEGDTERAVRAALDLVVAVRELGEDVGAPGLAARAGVVTGEVAVTVGLIGEGMVAGDAVNTAARLQTAADSGAVLVDDATRTLTHGAIEYADAGIRELKGKAELQQLWRAVRVRAYVGAQRFDGLEAPMTGRDVELRLVKDLFHAAVDRRQPRLLLVTGPAGVGKTRLGWEFEKYVDGLADPVYWHRGRALSYGDGAAFWALGEMIRGRVGIAEDDTPDVVALRLAAGIQEHIADPAEQAYVQARLARLLGVPADDSTPLVGPELFAGWRIFVERLAQDRPVAMLIEDAQYADTGTLDFLEHLLDWTRDIPLFVIVFSRPELESRRPRLGVGPNRTAIALDPLGLDSMNSLLASLVPGLPDETRQTVADQSDGIPLFAVETVRSLIDQGTVAIDGDRFRLVGDIGKLQVPRTLRQLLVARVDALDPAGRALVSDASVLGISFSRDSLTAVTSVVGEQVERGLQDLVRRGLFEISADALSPEQGQYRFTHGMLRQVAYETLTLRDRKQRHLAVAAFLADGFPGGRDEVAELIAQHFVDAIDCAPSDDDVVELRAAAVEALDLAGQRAERTGALTTAADSYARAADLLAGVGDSTSEVAAARLYADAANALQRYGRYEPAIAYAQQAVALFERHGEVEPLAIALLTEARAQFYWGHVAEARATTQRAVELAQASPGPVLVEALHTLAGHHLFTSRLEDADRISNEALALAQLLDVGPAIMSEVFLVRGMAHGFEDRLAQAVMYLREAIRIAKQSDDSVAMARVYVNLSSFYADRDPHEAAEAASLAIVHSRRVGAQSALVTGVVNLAIASIESGDWAAAQAAIDEWSDFLADDRVLAMWQAVFDALRGDLSGAVARLGELSELDDLETQDEATIALGGALAAYVAGEYEHSLTSARAAFDHADGLGMTSDTSRWSWPAATRAAYLLGDTAGVDGLLKRVADRPANALPRIIRAERALVVARREFDLTPAEPAADAAMKAALQGLRDVGSPWHLMLGLGDRAAQLIACGRAEEAVEALDEAESLAASVGAEGVLAQVRELRAKTAPPRA
jgi:class 3 adenylate cyclase/tetratricopeptide (TPR) repeat protein